MAKGHFGWFAYFCTLGCVLILIGLLIFVVELAWCSWFYGLFLRFLGFLVPVRIC